MLYFLLAKSKHLLHVCSVSFPFANSNKKELRRAGVLRKYVQCLTRDDPGCCTGTEKFKNQGD